MILLLSNNEVIIKDTQSGSTPFTFTLEPKTGYDARGLDIQIDSTNKETPIKAFICYANTDPKNVSKDPDIFI